MQPAPRGALGAAVRVGLAELALDAAHLEAAPDERTHSGGAVTYLLQMSLRLTRLQMSSASASRLRSVTSMVDELRARHASGVASRGAHGAWRRVGVARALSALNLLSGQDLMRRKPADEGKRRAASVGWLLGTRSRPDATSPVEPCPDDHDVPSAECGRWPGPVLCGRTGE